MNNKVSACTNNHQQESQIPVHRVTPQPIAKSPQTVTITQYRVTEGELNKRQFVPSTINSNNR